jgi:hypothetical protein
MKKEQIISLIDKHYNKPKLVNGEWVFKVKQSSLSVSDWKLKEKIKKTKVVKEKVVKEVVKDVVKEVKKRGRKPTIKDKVEIKKEVKMVVEKKKPAPNKKAKEHIEKIEKKVVKEEIKKKRGRPAKTLEKKIDTELDKLKMPKGMMKELEGLNISLPKKRGRPKKK